MGAALGSVNSRPILEPPGTGPVGHGGSFYQLLREAIPCSHSSYRNLHQPDTFLRLGCFSKEESEVWQATASMIYKCVHATLIFSPWKLELYEESQSLISWEWKCIFTFDVLLLSEVCFLQIFLLIFCYFVIDLIPLICNCIVLSLFIGSAVEISKAKIMKTLTAEAVLEHEV